MRAVDTNVVLRLLTRDDPVQTPIADTVFSEPVFVPLTVLLETAWVLASRYRLSRDSIVLLIDTLLNTATVTVPAEDAVRWALDRFIAGADLADMLHIAASRDAASFVTFDRDAVSIASDTSPIPIEALA